MDNDLYRLSIQIAIEEWDIVNVWTMIYTDSNTELKTIVSLDYIYRYH